MPAPHDVAIERGAKRVFAGANEWPGWCRSGRTEEAALVAHLADAEVAYLSKLGTRPVPGDSRGDVRKAALSAFTSRSRGEPPERTPRSGALWSPRYFMRRAAWHVLDHTWEIEYRSRPP